MCVESVCCICACVKSVREKYVEMCMGERESVCEREKCEHVIVCVCECVEKVCV